MILGIGNDLIDIRRIEKTIARFGERFINRIYTETEQAKADRRQNGNDESEIAHGLPPCRPPDPI